VLGAGADGEWLKDSSSLPLPLPPSPSELTAVAPKVRAVAVAFVYMCLLVRDLTCTPPPLMACRVQKNLCHD
jgi:hypothetical protein